MAEVAYFLGAGASAGGLPVVNKMADAINDLRQDLNSKLQNRLDKTQAFIINENLSELEQNCREHYSIDTYAKRLYLTDRTEFERLKMTLSFYFTITQLTNSLDKRYDNFFASVVQHDLRLPSKIKIISWNYDFQLEASFHNFAKGNLDSCNEQLNIHSAHEFLSHDFTKDKFSVIKMNGSAKLKGTDNKYVFLIDSRSKEQDVLVDLCQRYLRISLAPTKYKTDLKFAWELTLLNDFKKYSASWLSKIEVLVIIGYSFPFFNRAVDIALFSNMHQLNQIIIQDLNPENIEESLWEVLRGARGGFAGNIVKKKNTDQFFYPPELEVI